MNIFKLFFYVWNFFKKEKPQLDSKYTTKLTHSEIAQAVRRYVESTHYPAVRCNQDPSFEVVNNKDGTKSLAAECVLSSREYDPAQIGDVNNLIGYRVQHIHSKLFYDGIRITSDNVTLDVEITGRHYKKPEDFFYFVKKSLNSDAAVEVFKKKPELRDAIKEELLQNFKIVKIGPVKEEEMTFYVDQLREA